MKMTLELAQYKCNDNANNNSVTDTTGFYNGSMVNDQNNYTSEQSTAGKINLAFLFDGTNDYFNEIDQAAFSFGNAVTDVAFSVSMWVKFTDLTNAQGFFGKRKGTAAGEIEYHGLYNGSVSDQIFLTLFDNEATVYIGTRWNNVSAAMSTGNWYHLTFTYDGTGNSSGIKIYLNGVEQTTTDFENGSYTAMHNTTSKFSVGAFGEEAIRYFGGCVDDFRIFRSRELSQTDIDLIYNLGNGTETLLDELLNPPVAEEVKKIGGGWTKNIEKKIRKKIIKPQFPEEVLIVRRKQA